MKFFEDQKQVISYTVNELIATLEDDINDQKKNGVDSEDYAELEDKIDDIKKVQSLIEAAPELIEACKIMTEWWKEWLNTETPCEMESPDIDGMTKAINSAEGR